METTVNAIRPETTSEATANYASALFLGGLGLMFIGMGVGYVVEAVRGKKVKKD